MDKKKIIKLEMDSLNEFIQQFCEKMEGKDLEVIALNVWNGIKPSMGTSYKEKK